MRRDQMLAVMGSLVLGLAILGLLGGCGSGGNATTEALHGPSSHSSKKGRVMFPGPPPKGVQQGCLSAIAAVGKEPRIIDVTVHCVSHKHTREEYLLIGRHMLRYPHRRAPVTAYTHRPRVVDHAVRGSTGPCHREEKQIVACPVRFMGSSRVKVRLWVPPETRCTANVSVVMRRGTCPQKNCLAGMVKFYTLFRSKPRGC